MAALLSGEPVDDRPTLLCRSDGQRLLYRGAVNEIHSEPGGGKTWLALEVVKALLEAAEPVLYLDFESTGRAMAVRLGGLGVTAELVRPLAYIPAAGAVQDADVAWLVECIVSCGDGVQLVIIDSLGEALAFAGDGNDDATVARWLATVVRPLARAGAAVLLLDHVTKAVEGRGRFPIGSQRKLAAVDGVAYSLEVVQPWARDRSGSARLVVAKDRPGWIGAPLAVAAEVHFDVSDEGAHINIRLDAPSRNEDTPMPGGSRHLLGALERDGGLWNSFAEAHMSLGLSGDGTRKALAMAIRAGSVVEEPGARGAKAYRLVEELGASPHL
jgi:hypothetical protein